MINRHVEFLKNLLTEEQNKQFMNYILRNPTTTKDLNETALEALEQTLNNYGFKPEEFSKATTKWHKYLQNELFKLAMAIIQVYGSEDYRYDCRNQFAHNKSKEIINLLKLTI